jgi:hypothetical protein
LRDAQPEQFRFSPAEIAAELKHRAQPQSDLGALQREPIALGRFEET